MGDKIVIASDHRGANLDVPANYDEPIDFRIGTYNRPVSHDHWAENTDVGSDQNEIA